MAENVSDIERQVLAAAGETPDEDTGARRGPTYKLITEDKIPVSKQTGKLWQHRKDAAMKRMEKYREAWDEAIRYYNHDHTSKEEATPTTKGTRVRGDETENMVFSNVSTMMPILYSRNPEMEFTNENRGEEEQEEDRFATILERVINNIMRRKDTPGVNLKSKVRKATLFALLCNVGILKLDWVKKNDSSEAVLEDMNKIAEEMQKAKSEGDLIELEGKMAALEEQFELSRPAGPTLKNIDPRKTLIDPETEDEYLTDCQWIMEMDYLPTSYIKARYLEEGEKGSTESKLVYKPTHILKATGDVDMSMSNLMDSAFDEVNDRVLDANEFGYRDENEFKASQFTRVWYVWDRLMQRMYLFHDGDWTWPLWVWDKPLNITRFFPYFFLMFHAGTDNFFAKGEVTYYLDQQDAINEINAEAAKARRNIRTKVLYNSNKTKGDDVDAFLNQDDRTALGVPLGEGEKMGDAIIHIDPVILKYSELFDKRGLYAAIDRISGVNEIVRAQQLRTNTTQDAVNAMQDATQVRTDEKIDKIEEMVQDIALAISELALQEMTEEDVIELIGTQAQGIWRNMSPREFQSAYNINIVAGSTEKPTSKVKKKQAIELGQVLGQFVNASPAVVEVILKVFQKAFSEVDLNEDDWQFIRQAITAQLQRGASTGQGAGADGQAGAEAAGAEAEAAEQERRQNNPSLGDLDIRELFKTVMKALPPEAKKAVEQTVQSGINPADAVVQLLQGATQKQGA